MSDQLVVKQDESVAIEKLSPQDQNRAGELAQKIDLSDFQSLAAFGTQTQKNISAFSDRVLERVRTRDTGYVGGILTDLVLKVKELNVQSLSSAGFLSKVPIIGNMVNNVRRFIARYEKISTQVDKIVDELEKAGRQLLADITMLDNMYQVNRDYLAELEVYIAAGHIKLRELRENVLPQLKEEAASSEQSLKAQEYRDLLQALDFFEKKLHDLSLSRMVALQAGPQLRLIQGGNHVLVDKIQSSVLNTLPLWKNQVVIAISLFRQQKALKLQQQVAETTNELLRKNSELLKEGAVGVARESSRGIVELETLKKVNQDLISTVEDVIKINEEGRVKRREAESQLQNLEKDIKERLSSL